MAVYVYILGTGEFSSIEEKKFLLGATNNLNISSLFAQNNSASENSKSNSKAMALPISYDSSEDLLPGGLLERNTGVRQTVT